MDKKPSHSYISKFITNDRHVYVKVLWRPNEYDLFHVLLYDGSTSWSGKFSNDFAKQNSIRMRQTEEIYFQTAFKALKSYNPDFSYEFTSELGKETVMFSWKTRLGDKLVTHGIVSLHSDGNLDSNNLGLIDLLLLENTELRSTAKGYEEKIEDLNNEFERCESEIQKFTKIRASLDETVNEKFLELLKAKEKRLSMFKEDLQEFENK